MLLAQVSMFMIESECGESYVSANATTLVAEFGCPWYLHHPVYLYRIGNVKSNSTLKTFLNFLLIPPGH